MVDKILFLTCIKVFESLKSLIIMLQFKQFFLWSEFMNCQEIFERGIKFHHYCNTAYPLRPTSLKQYELEDTDEIYKVVKENIESLEEICLYVHIPFCQARCKFCEYVVLNEKPSEEIQNKYVSYLLKEIEMYRKIIKEKV